MAGTKCELPADSCHRSLLSFSCSLCIPQHKAGREVQQKPGPSQLNCDRNLHLLGTQWPSGQDHSNCSYMSL